MRPFFGLIDSGADQSVIPLQWAPKLGIDLAECRTEGANTAGGPCDVYYWNDGLKASVAGVTIHLNIAFAEVHTLLLGRSDFFHTFRVNFDHRRERFTLQQY